MSTKSEFVQIRVRPDQKAALKRQAERAGEDLSSYVLTRLLPTQRSRFEGIVAALEEEGDSPYALADLNDLLSAVSSRELPEVVADPDVRCLSDLAANYLAAMVEHACHERGMPPPTWTRSVPPIDEPYFATRLPGLRLHLLKSSPVAFKRRNLFVDSTLGARV